jgi:hypothetical protein
MKSLRRCTALISLVLLCMFSLVACASPAFDLDQSVGVAPGENAALCFEGELDPIASESSFSVRRVEEAAPEKLSSLTPEQIVAMVDFTPEQIEAALSPGVKADCPD